MTVHPVVRLGLPTFLFAFLVAAPGKRSAGIGGEPTPIAGAAEEPPPNVPLGELYHELAVSDEAGGPHLTVVEFSDFGCPYCGVFARETFPTLREEFVETGRVRWRFVPFVLGMFPNGLEAMRAATCVAEQGDEPFWRMHDLLFEKQEVWKASRDPDQLFRSYAVVSSGTDGDAFSACFDDARSADRATAANALARQGGVRSTPTFFIGRQMVQGALPVEEFRKVLEAALR
jgi:protein-disulfide isomerase